MVKIECPRCGANNRMHRSHWRLHDLPWLLLLMRPVRCIDCYARYHRFFLQPLRRPPNRGGMKNEARQSGWICSDNPFKENRISDSPSDLPTKPTDPDKNQAQGSWVVSFAYLIYRPLFLPSPDANKQRSKFVPKRWWCELETWGGPKGGETSICELNKEGAAYSCLVQLERCVGPP